jgi:hypothetical protein
VLLALAAIADHEHKLFKTKCIFTTLVMKESDHNYPIEHDHIHNSQQTTLLSIMSFITATWSWIRDRLTKCITITLNNSI